MIRVVVALALTHVLENAMIRFLCSFLCITSLVFMPLLAADGSDAIQLKVEKVLEYRTKTIEGEADDQESASLNVHVLLQGKPVLGAARYGQIKFKATDDKGTDLKMRESFLDEKEWLAIDREGLKIESPLPADAMRVQLSMAAAPRGATKIATLSGSVKVLAGTPVEVVIDDPASRAGKEIEHVELTKAGLKITLTTFNGRGGAGLGVYAKFKVVGKEWAIAKMDAIDADGKVRSDGSAASGGVVTPLSYEIYGQAALPDGAKLRITVLSDLKEIEVPIELKDVPLP